MSCRILVRCSAGAVCTKIASSSFFHLLVDGCPSQSADRLPLKKYFKKMVRSIFIHQSWRTLITGTTVCICCKTV